MTEQLCEAMVKISELASALGVVNIKALPGCWQHKVDDQWEFAVNGHSEPVDYEGTPILPYSAFVKFNGWPAGVVTPFGGEFVAGEAANEDTFLAALTAAIGAV